tara:strand:- start:2886 stop:3503 length:618 start_codon:yes stop_codon:yes gene_type:complete
MQKSRTAKNRLLISKLLLIAFIIVLTISEHGKIANEDLSIGLKILGFILILIGGFGRLWSSLYIEGNKNEKLISGGPYSMMRNPLYVFSLTLLLGYCCAIQSIIILISCLILFIVIYMPTIFNEEKILLSRHSDFYKEYYEKTPRFIPNFKLYQNHSQDNMIDVNIKKIQRVIVEIAGFTFFYGLIITLDIFHQMEYIKTFLSLI